MSSHQVQGLLASYCFPSYCRLRIVSTNIRLLKRKFVSTRCTNMVPRDHFSKLAKFHGLIYQCDTGINIRIRP